MMGGQAGKLKVLGIPVRPGRSRWLWAPFYAVGDLTARGMSLVGSDVAVDGFSQPKPEAMGHPVQHVIDLLGFFIFVNQSPEPESGDGLE